EARVVREEHLIGSVAIDRHAPIMVGAPPETRRFRTCSGRTLRRVPNDWARGSARIEPAVFAGAGDEAACPAFGLARCERRPAERELLRERVARREPVLAARARAIVAHALLREYGDQSCEGARSIERLSCADDP